MNPDEIDCFCFLLCHYFWFRWNTWLLYSFFWRIDSIGDWINFIAVPKFSLYNVQMWADGDTLWLKRKKKIDWLNTYFGRSCHHQELQWISIHINSGKCNSWRWPNLPKYMLSQSIVFFRDDYFTWVLFFLVLTSLRISIEFSWGPPVIFMDA
jgi:hypothetical protein